MNSYDNYTEKVKQYSEEPSETHEEPLQVENSLFDSELTQIPMLLSG